MKELIIPIALALGFVLGYYVHFRFSKNKTTIYIDKKDLECIPSDTAWYISTYERYIDVHMGHDNFKIYSDGIIKQYQNGKMIGLAQQSQGAIRIVSVSLKFNKEESVGELAVDFKKFLQNTLGRKPLSTFVVTTPIAQAHKGDDSLEAKE